MDSLHITALQLMPGQEIQQIHRSTKYSIFVITQYASLLKNTYKVSLVLPWLVVAFQRDPSSNSALPMISVINYRTSEEIAATKVCGF
jgi:hypothetical protein